VRQIEHEALNKLRSAMDGSAEDADEGDDRRPPLKRAS
jgi:hypothetical protein